MELKRKIFIILIIIITITNANLSFANLNDYEEVNIREIKEEVIETNKTVSNEPKIDSRIALIYDRKSGNIIYEKNGNKQTPMASTTNKMTT